MQVLDLLADPLVHLIRNAVDHGLEPPDTREAAGKPRRGTIRLIARQAGRFVEMLVKDDGRGIDATRVAEAAVKRGLLSEADVGRMSERELLLQLFRPAFSTRTTVSDVSGRGVGLDVVKSAIEDLGGSLALDARVGEGTTFILRLPVSIALVDALVLDLQQALYAIPSAYVEHIVEVEPSGIETAAGREVIRLESGVRVPLHDLATLLRLPPVTPPEDGIVRLVIVAEHDRRLALKVPGFVGELALVQEAMDPFLKGLRVVTGTAMLDGGRRVVLLNVVQLLDLGREEKGSAVERPVEAAGGASVDRVRHVLVIEDSDLTRSMVVAALESAGWRVDEAVNGRVGLEAFRREPPDLVITDLDMPVVDGFEVMRSIRSGADAADVPIAVFSTRDDDASKEAAAEAGADVFLVKSAFVADEALATFERLLTTRSSEEVS